MECIVCGNIIEHSNVHKNTVKIYENALNKSIIIDKLNKIFNFNRPLNEFINDVFNIIYMYYISNDKPILIRVYNLQCRIIKKIIDFIKYFIYVKSSNDSLIAYKFNYNSDNIPSTRKILFDYCYFGHSMILNSTTDGKCVLLYTGIDKGGLNISFDNYNNRGLLQFSKYYDDGNTIITYVMEKTTPRINETCTSPEVQSTSSSTRRPTRGLADSSPPEVTTTYTSTRRGGSSIYSSLKGRATPGDRGEVRDGMRNSTGPQVEPAADLREAEGEVNRRADGRTDLEWRRAVCKTNDGNLWNHNWTSGGDYVYVTSLSYDSMRSFGSIFFVSFSDYTVEIWKESISMIDFNDNIWECVSKDYVDSYPYYSSFNQCGEMILCLCINNLYIFEWNGICLYGIKLYNGSSSNIWYNNKILSTVWLNNHEFLSLTDNKYLILTRRNDIGQWNRIVSFDLNEIYNINGAKNNSNENGDGVPCNRIQYDNNKCIYILLNNGNIIKLNWLNNNNNIPDCNILEFDLNGVNKLKASDFIIDPINNIIGIISYNRKFIHIYNLITLKLLHTIKQPNNNLYAMGLSFLSKFNNNYIHFAIRWIPITNNIIYTDEDMNDVEHFVNMGINTGGSGGKNNIYPRCTILYKIEFNNISTTYNNQSTLHDILSNGSEITKNGKFIKRINLDGFNPRLNIQSNTIPKLSCLKPTINLNNDNLFRKTSTHDNIFYNKPDLFGKELNNNNIYSINEFIKRKNTA